MKKTTGTQMMSIKRVSAKALGGYDLNQVSSSLEECEEGGSVRVGGLEIVSSKQVEESASSEACRSETAGGCCDVFSRASEHVSIVTDREASEEEDEEEPLIGGQGSGSRSESEFEQPREQRGFDGSSNAARNDPSSPREFSSFEPSTYDACITTKPATKKGGHFRGNPYGGSESKDVFWADIRDSSEESHLSTYYRDCKVSFSLESFLEAGKSDQKKALIDLLEKLALNYGQHVEIDQDYVQFKQGIASSKIVETPLTMNYAVPGNWKLFQDQLKKGFLFSRKDGGGLITLNQNSYGLGKVQTYQIPLGDDDGPKVILVKALKFLGLYTYLANIIEF
ncbi:phosphoprotein [Wenzhou Myotis laniger tupavirus 1]|uniref:phosphoprotein n=1 Tax=Wenzhou Myotis laniger tupavirus 1 TaxID=2929005 RepID=UPI0024820FAC|nr:phosphoprotein [Wenzhou Myotis laniger tupavirus 1]UOX72920.1 phosphoprotein [Wenzhou Myotis laniger tupavirus 1]